MRVGSRLRRHLGPTIWVAVAIAVVTATVLTVAAGARRTATAPDRYTASVGGDLDASIQQREGPPLTDKVAALPGVADVSAYTFLFAGLHDPRVPESLISFAGDRPLSSRVIAGRDLDPRDPHGFVADRSFVAATGAQVGDQFPFGSISRATIESGKGFGGESDGATFEATLVGVLDSPDQISDSFTVAIFPSTVLREDVGIAATVMQVRLEPGTSLKQLRLGLDGLSPNRATFAVDSGEVISDDIRHAVDAQAIGLWLLAAVLAAGALVALGQLLTRHVQRADHDRTPLLAVGFYCS
jgi:hypothetical protein